ncbi:biotin--[acetyl-CoA-carboxylase] ligase [Leptotrichia sp. OH3620_COT-345]|uniref:biotin--[acetyl-CoA-carboxylase] ligase n=1 Tax=Leptotrichia sp. OH3620_COT-345 TaxID=2491048 RepID=UPI000F655BC9|nr:biotin--[acetyl-CoA-carboxylase] ligase [Leptotrichia sp. OH3620_COT-345]RRD38474.1 biotin--[acetyl-CoA-carboxylase] ligase [Leptotrichia sp. OH3620_COT-345]
MKFINFDEIDSTNDYLRKNHRLEEFEVITAKKQTAGKGKRGSAWISNEGAALFSFAVENNKEGLQEKITIFSGYAVYEILKKYIEKSFTDSAYYQNLKFKWPNDIYYKDKKICGILCEKIREHIIIGIGININNTDFGMYKDKGISLFEICGKKYSVETIIKEVMSFFEEKYKSVNKNWENILEKINEESYLKGKTIKIKKEKKLGEKAYKFLRIDRSGKICLIGKGDTEEIKFESLDFEVIL